MGLWDNLPAGFRERAAFLRDLWEPYKAVLPADRPHAVAKDQPDTQRIERLNCTPGRCCSRLVRKALSFSKKRTNPIGAIWYFVHHYNAWYSGAGQDSSCWRPRKSSG